MEIKDLGLQFLVYLGDSVYVGFDGYHIQLITWNGYSDDPRNKIALEPSVYEALLRWVENLKISTKGEIKWH
jgi:hypothetical protein